MNTDERLNAIETYAAGLEVTVQDLSDVVAGQWKEVDALKVEIRRLTDRLEQMEANPKGQPGEDLPPHY